MPRADNAAEFLSSDAKEAFSTAGLQSYSFPDGLREPAVPLVVEPFPGFDRLTRLVSEPTGGVVRLYPRGSVTAEDVINSVREFSPWSRVDEHGVVIGAGDE